MFKKGQKVVCRYAGLPSGVEGIPFGIKKGNVYTIAGFDKCEFCGAELLLLADADSGSRKECVCSTIPVFPSNAFIAKRFEPLNEEKASNKETEVEKSDAHRVLNYEQICTN